MFRYLKANKYEIRERTIKEVDNQEDSQGTFLILKKDVKAS